VPRRHGRRPTTAPHSVELGEHNEAITEQAEHSDRAEASEMSRRGRDIPSHLPSRVVVHPLAALTPTAQILVSFDLVLLGR